MAIRSSSSPRACEAEVLGLRAGGAGGRRGDSSGSACSAAVIEPDLRREARGARRLARRHARAGSGRPSRSPRATGSRSRSSASTARAPTSSSSAAHTRPRSRRARRRSSSSTRSGSRRPRPPPTSSGRRSTGSTSPCTGTATTTSASRTAAAVAAVQAGATWVQGTVNGMGERAGNANLHRGRARARGALRRSRRGSTSTKARELAALVQERSGYHLASVDAGHGRRISSRARRRGREPVPRSACDRGRTRQGSSAPSRGHRAREEERASTRSG